MILTHEHIGDDPAAFLNANPSLLADSHPKSYTIIAGQDKDLRVWEPPLPRRPSGEVQLQNVSPILGNLYQHGVNVGHSVNGRTYQTEWFPSPAAVNNLIQRLGMEPGVDCLKFVHGQFDDIPAADYTNHLSAGEYPLSTGGINFDHDRRSDHAIGVLLLPTMVTREIVKRARRHDDYIGKEPLAASTSIAEDFDTTTEVQSRIAHSAWNDLQEGHSYSEYTLEQMGEASRLYEMPRTFWRSNRYGIPHKQSLWRIGALTFERVQELQPRIEALQAEVAAGVTHNS